MECFLGGVGDRTGMLFMILTAEEKNPEEVDKSQQS